MKVVNRAKITPFVTKDTSLVRELLHPRHNNIVRQSLAEAALEPGMATEAHLHPNTEEVYYILSGQGILAIEDESTLVSVGDVIGIDAGRRHQIWNTGHKTLIFLCVCVPAYENRDTILCNPLL